MILRPLLLPKHKPLLQVSSHSTHTRPCWQPEATSLPLHLNGYSAIKTPLIRYYSFNPVLSNNLYFSRQMLVSGMSQLWQKERYKETQTISSLQPAPRGISALS